MIILISLIIYIPAFWCKKKKYSVFKYFAIAILLSSLLSASAIFFPYKESGPHSFEIEAGRFYASDRNILFVSRIQDNTLSGSIISKSYSSPIKTIELYSGTYSVSEDMVLMLHDNYYRYIIAEQDKYSKFFNFFIRVSAFIITSIEEPRKHNLKAIFIKSFAIMITISSISFFFSTGRWPLINFSISQIIVICFLWFNYVIQRIPIPHFLQEAENLIPFDAGLYYFAYIVMSFSILLIKLLSIKLAESGADK